MSDRGSPAGHAPPPGGEPDDAELKEILGNLEFFLEMDVAEELAAERAWDEPGEPTEDDEATEEDGNERD